MVVEIQNTEYAFWYKGTEWFEIRPSAESTEAIRQESPIADEIPLMVQVSGELAENEGIRRGDNVELDLGVRRAE